MHKVSPSILTIKDDETFNLSGLTHATLINDGTYTIKYGFGDGMRKLKEGQQVGFEAGSNAVFGDNTKLKIEFEKPENISSSDFKLACIIHNKLTEESRFFSNLKPSK